MSNPIINISVLQLEIASEKKVVESVIKDNKKKADETNNQILTKNSAKPITTKSKMKLKKKLGITDKLM